MVNWSSTLLDDDMHQVRLGLMRDEMMKYVDKISFIMARDPNPGDDLPQYTIDGRKIDTDLYSRRPTIHSSQAAYSHFDDFWQSGTRVIEEKIVSMTHDLMEYIHRQCPDELVNIMTLSAYAPPPVDDFAVIRRLVVSVWSYKLLDDDDIIEIEEDIFSNFKW